MDLIIARTVHVLAVVLWIGGLAVVTTTIFPSIRRNVPPRERLGAFVRFEGRFAPQARIWVLLAGVSGAYMVVVYGVAERFASLHYWWMNAMVAVWAIFAIMLFVLEPLLLHRKMKAAMASPEGERLFDRMERLHRLLLACAAITLLGAVAGSHGL